MVKNCEVEGAKIPLHHVAKFQFLGNGACFMMSVWIVFKSFNLLNVYLYYYFVSWEATSFAA